MKYFTDGFMHGSNPSPVGGGYTIVDENNNLIKREVIEKVGFTNNEAEILGMLECLRLCSEGDVISTDSMCILSWMNAGRSKMRPDLNELLFEANSLMFSKNVNVMWERRNFNLAGIFNENEQRQRHKDYFKRKRIARTLNAKLFL